MSDIDTHLMMSITRQKLESLYRTNNLHDLQDRLLAFISYKKPFYGLWRLKFSSNSLDLLFINFMKTCAICSCFSNARQSNKIYTRTPLLFQATQQIYSLKKKQHFPLKKSNLSVLCVLLSLNSYLHTKSHIRKNANDLASNVYCHFQNNSRVNT